MTMRVVFIKDTPDHPAGWEGFLPRSLGRRLCHQNITIPGFGKEKDKRYIAVLKAKEKAKREAKAKILELKKLKKTKRKRAVSVKAKNRETATMEQIGNNTKNGGF